MWTPSSYSYLWMADLLFALEDLARQGFEQTELMAAFPHFDLAGYPREIVPEIRQASRRSGVRVVGINPPGLDLNIASPDSSLRAWSKDQYVTLGRIAAEVEASYLVVHPGRRHVLVPAPEADARAWVLESLAAITEELAPEGVRVLFENTPTRILDTAAECVDVVRELGPDNLGLVYDVANAFMVEDVDEGLRVVRDHVEVVHLSDTTAQTWQHAPIGTGAVDFRGLASTVEEIDFSGCVVLETVHQREITEGLARDRDRLAAAGWSPAGR